MRELEEIRNKLYGFALLDETFEFKCFADNMFTYTNEEDISTYNDYEITFIANNNVLMWDMTARDLLNLSKIEYFHFRVFNNENVVVYDKAFNINKQAN